EENHMMLLLSRAGLRYNKAASGPGAETERRGLAGPVRDLLGGETSPAAFCSSARKLLLLLSFELFEQLPEIVARSQRLEVCVLFQLGCILVTSRDGLSQQRPRPVRIALSQ